MSQEHNTPHRAPSPRPRPELLHATLALPCGEPSLFIPTLAANDDAEVPQAAPCHGARCTPLAIKLARTMAELAHELDRHERLGEGDLVGQVRARLAAYGVVISPSARAQTSSQLQGPHEPTPRLDAITLELTFVDGDSDDPMTLMWVSRGRSERAKRDDAASTRALHGALLGALLAMAAQVPPSQTHAPGRGTPTQPSGLTPEIT